MPQTPEEFRHTIAGTSLGRVESFEIDRSLREVTLAFQLKATECLNVSVRRISHSITNNHSSLTEYRATVVPGTTRTELHLQHLHKQNAIYPSQPPNGGAYMIVLDAYPLPGNRTRLQIFSPAIGASNVHKAIRGWATGQDMSCPDMTQVGL
jgi:hypothetical protein